MNVKVEKWKLLYAVLKIYFKLIHKLFYRKFVVEGLRNIPKDKTIIFAPNHQNAVMDPLAMIFSTPYQIVFLARGDTFKKPTVAKIFYNLKILPIFRQRDGKKALKKNEEIFNISVNVLKHNKPFCLFPEAQHNPVRRLRILKKGIQRIAFQALEETDFKLDIQIIPTGIYYEDKDNSYSYLQIKYGNPIPISEYLEQIKENEQKAMSTLSSDMAPKIKPLIIDIEENEDYHLIENIRSFFSDNLMKRFKIDLNDKNRFLMDQKLIKHLKNKDISLRLRKELNNLFSKIKQKNWSIETILKKETFLNYFTKSILFILFFPFALQGGIINLLPFALSKYLRTHFIKDPQFTSSIKFVVGGIIMPIYFLILSLISLIFAEYYWALLVLILSPLSSYISYYYFKYLKLFINSISYRLSSERKEIENLKTAISEELNVLFLDFKYSK